MKKKLAITDLTRMSRGCVCIAGYDKDGCCFRPTFPPTENKPGECKSDKIDKTTIMTIILVDAQTAQV